jgi:hypothetical protein
MPAIVDDDPARYGQNGREMAMGDATHCSAAGEGYAESWAILASLVNTAKLQDLDPRAT